jgi:enoyl-CoA hydratase
MAEDNVLLETDGAVAVVTINRPAALNALDLATLSRLAALLQELGERGTARAAVLTGAGEKAFVAGADIAAMEKLSAVEGRAFSRFGQDVFAAVENLPIPVIAAVQGFALGGGLELALACDLILAGERARFGQPEINLGIIPGFGGTQRLPRRIGLGRARELIYSGRMIDAAEALRIGLVNRVLPNGELPEAARALAAELAGKAPVAVQQAKAAINAGADLDLTNACRYESEAFAVCFGTEDRGEGMRAFLEKRPALMKGK